jgi:hypothetical protein
MPEIVRLCLASIERNVPDAEVWTIERWRDVYDGRFGPWRRIARRRPNVQSDLLRYWLLGAYGGIWIDADYIALGDLRGIWNPAADYTGYLDDAATGMPYTAVMAAPLGSRVVQRQCELAREMIAARKRIGTAAGPRLTRTALAQSEGAVVNWLPREQFHPVRWARWLRLGHARRSRAHPFGEGSVGVMLIHQVVNLYRLATEAELMTDPTIIGQALRRALG